MGNLKQKLTKEEWEKIETSEFQSGSVKRVTTLCVIDHALNGVFIYDMNFTEYSEDMEAFITSQGHHLSNCSWGEFDGNINDLRE